jgi:hypothetical protein
VISDPTTKYDTGWQTFTLGTGENPANTGAVTYAEYRRIGRMVHLRASRVTTVSYAPVATGGDWGNWNMGAAGSLPAEVRPTRNVNLLSKLDDIPVSVMLMPSGTINVTGGTNRTYAAGSSLVVDGVYMLD